MKYYDFKKAKSFIDQNKEQIANAILGMDEDWFWTGETVFEDGAYTIELEGCTEIGGIDGSYWATPVLEIEYKDGRVEKYNCYTGESDGANKSPFLMGVISEEISAKRAAMPRKEIQNE